MSNYGSWRPIRKNLGLLDAINKKMYWLSNVSPNDLPNLHMSSTLLVASDYSGEHANANYQTISLIITDADAVYSWNQQRLKVRQQYLSDGRRMSFKQLRDRRRWLSLNPFLSAANELRGLSVTIAIHSSINSLFSDNSPLDLSNPDLTKYSHWNKNSLEKLFRVSHFISIFLAGMSRAGQNVLWFTDDDSIAPNVQGLKELTTLFSYVASEYLEYDLGHLRVGIPSISDTPDRLLEDLLAIPDLIAGTVSEILTLQGSDNELIINVPPSAYLTSNPFMPQLIQPQSKEFKIYKKRYDKFLTQQDAISAKTACILNWLGSCNHELKRLAVIIDPDEPKSDKLSIRWLNFHAYEDTH